MTYQTLQTWETTYNADSVEWCPIDEFRDIFVCGTYQLSSSEENGSQRLGNINLFLYNFNIAMLSLKQTVKTSGVLDQKWCNHAIDGFPILGVANAVGALQIYSLLKECDTLELKLVANFPLNSKSKVIATSLDWSSNKHFDLEPRVAVTDTSGNIHVFKFASSELILLQTWSAHGYEAWICAFDCWKPTTIFSGGDDCCLKMFDTNCSTKAQFTITREMGITSLHFKVFDEHILASGGYDEIMCLRDLRMLKNPLGEVSTGGGIWRLKWNPQKRHALLSACMHNGFAVLDCKDNSTPTINLAYKQHESLAYGADWCYQKDNVIATCTFYDCKLNIVKIYENKP